MLYKFIFRRLKKYDPLMLHFIGLDDVINNLRLEMKLSNLSSEVKGPEEAHLALETKVPNYWVKFRNYSE